MSSTLNQSFTKIEHLWTEWKIAQASKKFIYQYDNDEILYTIWGYDGPEVHVCTIFKELVPYSIVDSGYSQAQNDSDKSDFETNFLPNVNKSIDSRGILTDHSGITSSTPNTSTQIMAANSARQYLFIQNIDSSTVWINFTAAASQGIGSIRLESGASFVMEGTSVSTEIINIVSNSASVPYTAKEK